MNLLLDLLFPKRCVSCGRLGNYICKNCFSQIEFIEKPVCPVCQRQAVGGKTHPGCRNLYRLDGLVVVCRYRGPIKLAIAKVKYKWVYDIEKVLVDILVSALWKFDLPGDLILVPVPLHARRKRWRGFNQAEILGKALAKTFNVPISTSLIRISEVRPQVGLDRKQRRENVKGAFAIRGSTPKAQTKSPGVEPLGLEGKSFLLVDDVYTSGATMAECCRVLKKAGAREVWGMAVVLG